MIKNKTIRASIIMQLIRRQGIVTTQDVANELKTCTATARRQMEWMEHQGYVTIHKVHYAGNVDYFIYTEHGKQIKCNGI